MQRYQHTQMGTVVIAMLALLGVIVVALVSWQVIAVPEPNVRIAIWSVLIVVAVALLLFYRLAVTVDDGGISLAFGMGLIRRTIAFQTVQSAEVVTTPWYYGFGIRLTKWGWMWNISGVRGVQLTYKTGKRFRIGTDDPDGLCAAIRARLR